MTTAGRSGTTTSAMDYTAFMLCSVTTPCRLFTRPIMTACRIKVAFSWCLLVATYLYYLRQEQVERNNKSATNSCILFLLAVAILKHLSSFVFNLCVDC